MASGGVGASPQGIEETRNLDRDFSIQVSDDPQTQIEDETAMMTEYGYVEEAMLEWLAGKGADPNDHGLGWTYRTEADMEVYGRNLTDPIVEALLIPNAVAKEGFEVVGFTPDEVLMKRSARR